ncbi:hypothetical protein ACFQ6H_29470, partial [Rhodococcus sp. NPDC056506]
MSSTNSRSTNSRIADFRSYDVAARRAEIVRQTGLTEADIAVYDAANGLTLDQADRMVENVLGVIGIPVGVATNFTINGKDYLIPLATEAVLVGPAEQRRAVEDEVLHAWSPVVRVVCGVRRGRTWGPRISSGS